MGGHGDQRRWLMDGREEGSAKISESGDAIDLSALGFRKVAYSISEAVELIGIGRTSIYAAIKRGDLGVGKAGRRTVLFAYGLAKSKHSESRA